jgi:D-tyrosyl-tRNA(Tyr) deacylase
MRAVLQRVLKADVTINRRLVAEIDRGILAYVSVAKGDTTKNAEFIANKMLDLRIFEDQNGKMNLSVRDVGGSVLVVSNFTLHGDCRKGRRPSFDAAAEPAPARELYEKVISLLTEQGVNAQTGSFGEHMHVSCVNDGPVTFVIESPA